jgi:glycosyltransferase involved in cell wall biosynthesis
MVYRRPKPGFHVLVPLYIPALNSFWEKVNAWLVRAQVGLLETILGIKRCHTLLWISGGFTMLALVDRGFCKSVYQAADLISAFRTDNESLRAKLRERERELCQKVDVVFASSPMIRQKLEKISGRKVRLLLHGVDVEHFRKRFDTPKRMAVIRGYGYPVAGYFGSLSDSNDQKALLCLAENGFSVVLIGQVLGDYTALRKHERIHFLGRVPYEQLPAYGQAFDVGLMLWKPAEWIQNCFPIKTLEYLALGKPIVTCPIPVVTDLFPDFVFVAKTAADVPVEARRAITENSREHQQARIRAAAEHTWGKRFEQIMESLDESRT